MKRFFLLLALAILAVSTASAIFVVGSGGGSAGSLQPSANLITERFEGPGYSGTNVWTWTASGTINSNYNAVATNILAGSYSLLMVSSAQTVNTYVAFANQTNCVGYMLFKRLSSSSSYRLFSVRNSSGTVVMQVNLNAQRLEVRAGSAGGVATTNIIPRGVLSYIRWSYAKGTGADAFGSVELSTNGVFTATGDNYAQDTTGNATTDAGRLMLGADNSTAFNVVWDNIYVSTATATNDFSNLHP